MGTPLRQSSFLGGELAPEFWGRVDLPVYRAGGRVMRNFFPSHRGSLHTRPGTRHLGYTKGVGGNRARLIPFVFSDGEAYALEFGANYVRFWSSDAQVESSPGVPLEVATPYGIDQVFDIRFAQTGNILTLVHPEHPVYELRRTSALVWTMVNLFTDSTAFAAPEPKWINLTEPYAATTEPMFVDAPDYDGDPTHPAREWIYLCSQMVQQKSTGWVFETLAVPVTKFYNGTDEGTIAALSGNTFAVYEDMKVTLRRCVLGTPPTYPDDLPAGWEDETDFAVLATKYYRGRAELFGFIGTTKTTDFVDVGNEPDYSHQPIRGTNPFLIYNQAGVAVDNDYPRAVAFFQERRCFAGGRLRPASVIASKTGDYFNFDRNLVHVPGEALEYELAARQFIENRHLLPHGRRLLVLSDSGVRYLAGHDTSPLDFDSVDSDELLDIGCTNVRPLVVKKAALFCRTKGAGVLAFPPGKDDVEDLSDQSQHLFIGQTQELNDRPFFGSPYIGKAITDWTYAEDPWGVVWAVREDGMLLSLTYKPGAYSAWARHDTDGSVVSVCAVPQGEEDVVYMVVGRSVDDTITTYRVERMNSRVRRGLVDDDAAVDAAVRYEGVPTRTITGLDHLEGKEVYATISGASQETGKNATPWFGPMTVSGGSVTLPDMPTATIAAGGTILDPVPAKVVVYVGLPFTCDFGSLDATPGDAKLRQKTTVRVGIEVDQSRGMWTGQTFEAQDEWQQRDIADGYAQPGAASALIPTNVRGTWDQTARVCISQRLPLPLTILGILREVDYGE